MKKLIQIIAISCMPFLTGVVGAEEIGPHATLADCQADPAVKHIDSDGDRIYDHCDDEFDGVDTDGATTITNPHDRYGFANPTGFERMGYGFAQPIITIIPGYGKKTDGKITAYKPVVIIAAGYDPTKDYRGGAEDDATGDPYVKGSGPKTPGLNDRAEDKVGNAIYFLDAVSGKIVARIVGDNQIYDNSSAPEGSMGAIGNSVTLKETDAGQIVDPDLKHSIPATITAVDSQGDGLTDRIYFIDVIGNIWRLDIIPATSGYITSGWKLNKFAELGTDGSVNGDFEFNDRRFFNQLDVVRTRRLDGVNVDALLVGSGNIADPKGSTAAGNNAFFMIYDEFIQPGDHAFDVVEIEDLYNASLDSASGAAMGTAVTTAIQDSGNPLKGWYLPLAANEKVVSAATTINGTAFFTTIEVGPAEKGCAAPATLPESWLYAVNMHTAAATFAAPWVSVDADITGDKRRKSLENGNMAFQQIEPHVSTAGDVSIILPGGGEDTVGNADGTAKKLEGASTYWRTDNQ